MIPFLSVVLLIVCLWLFSVHIPLMLLVAFVGIVGLSQLVGKAKVDYEAVFTSIGLIAMFLCIGAGLIGAVYSAVTS